MAVDVPSVYGLDQCRCDRIATDDAEGDRGADGQSGPLGELRKVVQERRLHADVRRHVSDAADRDPGPRDQHHGEREARGADAPSSETETGDQRNVHRSRRLALRGTWVASRSEPVPGPANSACAASMRFSATAMPD